MTTQDLVKGLDFSTAAKVGATQLNQLVDVARAAEDKGFLIITEDTANDTPLVPNPNTADGQGVVPTWWKRYIWIRHVWDATLA